MSWHVLVDRKELKVDLTAAKTKYYVCFNSIPPVCGKYRNEFGVLHLVTSLPSEINVRPMAMTV